MDIVLEIIKLVLVAGIVFVTAYFTMKNFLDDEKDRRAYDLKTANQTTVLPLKLQAYERIVIFLERINPNTLIVRVNKSGFTAHQLHMELIKTVKTEYEHNLSQQIYVSRAAWELVKNTKEEIIKLINISSTKVLADGNGNDLAMLILNVSANLDKKLPNDIAIDAIKKEIGQLF
ncbi:MAG: hypothetical protein KF900_04455 [Bacteroidetes bacterium]|nr:hypothetical protein [Bacteroidota bacterium]